MSGNGAPVAARRANCGRSWVIWSRSWANSAYWMRFHSSVGRWMSGRSAAAESPDLVEFLSQTRLVGTVVLRIAHCSITPYRFQVRPARSGHQGAGSVGRLQRLDDNRRTTFALVDDLLQILDTVLGRKVRIEVLGWQIELEHFVLHRFHGAGWVYEQRAVGALLGCLALSGWILVCLQNVR